MNPIRSEIRLQRDYYARTAALYEGMHVQGGGEHDLACALIHSLSNHYGFRSVLDVGSGTGRAVAKLSQDLPGARIIGVEPVEALRRVGHRNGIPEEHLIDGDATRLDMADSSFDLVCELGVLHHIPKPRLAVTEMIRVAKKAIFLSDSNRFGSGSVPSRYSKLLLWRLGLWPLANWIKTKGNGYIYGEGDGVAYSYSVFDDYKYIRSQCDKVMIFNLDGFCKSALTGAPHVGLFGLKKLSGGK
jgi:SAM-dependent methyltransferase